MPQQPVIARTGPHPGPDHPDVARAAGLHLAGRRLPMISPARLYVCGITP